MFVFVNFLRFDCQALPLFHVSIIGIILLPVQSRSDLETGNRNQESSKEKTRAQHKEVQQKPGGIPVLRCLHPDHHTPAQQAKTTLCYNKNKKYSHVGHAGNFHMFYIGDSGAFYPGFFAR